MTILADVSSLVNRTGWSLPLFGIALLALWLAKFIYQKTEKFNFAEQLTSQDNPAFGTALTGYLLGVTFALMGAFVGNSADNWPSLKAAAGLLALQGVLIVVLMRASVFIVQATVLRGIPVRDEIVRDRNIGAGAILAGGALASGLVLQGALAGHSDSVLLAVRDVLVYWLAGQIILAIGAALFCKMVRFDFKKALEIDNNAAAGISLGGFLTAVGIIVRAALAGASSDLVGELGLIVVDSVIGLVLLVVAAIVAAHLFLPESPMAKEISEDKNPAAGLISAALFIAVALLLSQVIAG
ncbi:MAG TPA: DUF350 domain-containing protein [Chthoniobacteraceae bacterium]|jgi:uncharacterized membrane protein YjfL (UPF0719 family)|nr:DUF350 domain-containing protein [Chthoniobacteraceae bacterium]